MQKTIFPILQAYCSFFPEEKENFSHLTSQLESGDQNILTRSNMIGHMTACGIVLSRDNHVLLIYHNTLGRYLQPSGHTEAIDASLIETAIREIREEVGISHIALHPWCQDSSIPIMIDTHMIPANPKKNEGDHFHHDFMYIFTTDDDTISLDKNEVSRFEWIPVEMLIGGDDISLGRTAEKMKRLGIT